MDEAERERLKEKRRAVQVLRGNGIDLDSADLWVVGGLEEPKKFFHCLLHLVPPDTTLYFEGVDIVPEVARVRVAADMWLCQSGPATCRIGTTGKDWQLLKENTQ